MVRPVCTTSRCQRDGLVWKRSIVRVSEGLKFPIGLLLLSSSLSPVRDWAVAFILIIASAPSAQMETTVLILASAPSMQMKTTVLILASAPSMQMEATIVQ